ncbi:MAG: (d)CMP kinase [Bdellovibrio sp.]
MQKVIAIDGPSGSGKSTVAKRLAKFFNVTYIDTGAMFRAIGLYLDQEGVPFEEGPELKAALSKLKLEYAVDDKKLVVINDHDVSTLIREHRVSGLASVVSQLPSVRDFLLKFQRDLGKKIICVMEGRDIGTVVFPEAFCKFFVTASVEIRARRRYDQLVEMGQSDISMDQLIEDVAKRDELDSNRKLAPLREAADAIHVDTSNMNLEEVVESLAEIARKKAKEIGLSL